MEKPELTALEQQQQAQIKEMELIINALESSNKLLDFRLNVVLKQLQDANKKIVELEKGKQESPAPKQPKSKPTN